MTDPQDAAHGSRKTSKRRRRLLIVILIAALATGAWRAVEYVVDVDRFRPAAVTALENATGLPVRIDSLDFDILPAPNVQAHGVFLGEDDLQLSVRRIDASLDLHALWERRIEISAIDLAQVEFILPADTATWPDRLKSLGFKGDREAKLPGEIRLGIQEVAVTGGAVYLAGREEPLVTFSITAQDVLSNTIKGQLTAAAAKLGADAEITADVTVKPKEGPSFQGTLALHDIEPGLLAETPLLAGALVNLDVAVIGKDPQHIAAEVEAAVTESALNPLNGTLTAAASWLDGALDASGIQWTSPGMAVQASLTRSADGVMTAKVNEALFGGDAVTELLGAVNMDKLAFGARDYAQMELRDVVANFSPGAKPDLASGRADFQGFDLFFNDGFEIAPDLHGQVLLDHGTLRVTTLESDGIALTGTVTPDLDTGAVAITASGAADLPLGMISRIVDAGMLPRIDGTARVRQFRGTFGGDTEGPLDLLIAGVARNATIHLDMLDAQEPFVFQDVHGPVRYENGSLIFEKVEADWATVTGSILIDSPEDETVIDLAGSLKLNRERLGNVLPMDSFSTCQGDVALERVWMTIKKGRSGTPADLDIQGVLSHGDVAVLVAGVDEKMAGLSGPFAIDAASVYMNLGGESARLGPVHTKGRYFFEEYRWGGDITCNIHEIAKRAITKEEQQESYLPFFAMFGERVFEVDVEWPAEGRTSIATHAVCSDEPRLEGHVFFVLNGDRWDLDTIDALAHLPLGALSPVLPASMTAEGLAETTFRYRPTEQTFGVNSDMTECAISAGPFLRKHAGHRFIFELDGKTSETEWLPVGGQVAYQGTVIPFGFADGRIHVDDLNLDLERIAGLLPDTASIKGAVHGSIAVPPLDVQVQFEDVGIALTPELALDSLDGAVSCSDGQWACRDLCVRGANSDFRLNLAQQGNSVTGSLKGSTLDINAIQTIQGLLSGQAPSAESQGESAPPEASTPPAAPDAPAPSPQAAAQQAASPALTGKVSFDVDQLIYKLGTLDAVHADVAFDGHGVHVRDLACRPYSGTARGAVDILEATPEDPARVVIDLDLEDVGARILDELLFENLRGIQGNLSGEVALTAPLAEGNEIMRGCSGSATLMARDGTFGKLGVTTKFLTVLKTAEIVRLRLPALRDEGLTFEECIIDFSIENGILTMKELALQDPAYSVDASGKADFTREQTDIRIRVNLLESVTGLMENVPIVGEAAATLFHTAELRLVAEGSPYDPEIRIEDIARPREGPKRAGETAVELIEGTLGTIFRQPKK